MSPDSPGASRSARPGEADRWMLQAEAAAIAGCSVSVIRKWRRTGAIADRTRTSAGGMKRVEVRLADVLHKMQDSMPERISLIEPVSEFPVPEEAPATPTGASVQPAELEIFVRHIAEAERRAAAAEAELQASVVMTTLLRERVESLQAVVDSTSGATPTDSEATVRQLARLAQEIRRFRKEFEDAERDGPRHDAQARALARRTYDAALLSLCVAAGIPTRSQLGANLAPGDRTRLATALAEMGLDVVP